jgi:hypothetical protein
VCKYDGQARRAACAFDAFESRQLFLEHVAVEKEQRAESGVLGGSSDLLFDD